MSNSDGNNSDYREKYIRVLEDRIHVTDRLRDEEARFSTLSADVVLMHKEIIQLRAALTRFSVPPSYTPSPAHITEFTTHIIRQAMALDQPDSFNNSQLAASVTELYHLEAWAGQSNHDYSHMHLQLTDRNQYSHDSQNRCQIHQPFASDPQQCHQQQQQLPPASTQQQQHPQSQTPSQPNSHTYSRASQPIQPKPTKTNPRSKDASSSSTTPAVKEMLPIHPAYPPGSIIPWPKIFEDAHFLKPGFILSDNQVNSAEKLALRFLIKNYGVERANGYQVKHVYGKRERCFGIPQEMVKEFLSVSWFRPSEDKKAAVTLPTQIAGPSDGTVSTAATSKKANNSSTERLPVYEAGAAEQSQALTHEQQTWAQQRNQQQLMAKRVRDEQHQLQLKQIQLQEHQKNVQEHQFQLQQHQQQLQEFQEQHQSDSDSHQKHRQLQIATRQQQELTSLAPPAWLSHQLLSPEEVIAAQQREESKRQAQAYLQTFIKARKKDPDVAAQQISEPFEEFFPDSSPPPQSCTTETAPNSANPIRSASLESFPCPPMGYFPAAPSRRQLFTEFSESGNEPLACPKCNQTVSESDPEGSKFPGCDHANLQNCEPVSTETQTEIEPDTLRITSNLESLARSATPQHDLEQTQQQLPTQPRQLKLRLIAPMPETIAADVSLSTTGDGGEEKAEGGKSTPRRSGRSSTQAGSEGSSRRSSVRLRKEDRAHTKDPAERKPKKLKLSNSSSQKTEKKIVYDTFHKLNKPVQSVALDQCSAPISGAESDYVHAATSAEQSEPLILSPDIKESLVKYASLISSIVPQYKDLLREKRTLVKRKVKEYLISRIGTKQLNMLTIFGAEGVPNTYGIPEIMIPEFSRWANQELREHIRTLAEEQNISSVDPVNINI
ncbi:hypothetical protein BJ741DRAFT_588940 [Chytriomyces cf. hyalinus JEL632]|nr:hypothetical protein BJ741DRAFT_588940 [Chytriomyces cf. hyalinus JEL632]